MLWPLLMAHAVSTYAFGSLIYRNVHQCRPASRAWALGCFEPGLQETCCLCEPFRHCFLLSVLSQRFRATKCTAVDWHPTDASPVQVGDQSDFVTGFSRTLAELGPRLGRSLSENHFRYVCDKLAASFCPRFYEAVFRCRKISEAGSQQLLLDTQARIQLVATVGIACMDLKPFQLATVWQPGSLHDDASPGAAGLCVARRGPTCIRSGQPNHFHSVGCTNTTLSCAGYPGPPAGPAQRRTARRARPRQLHPGAPPTPCLFVAHLI